MRSAKELLQWQVHPQEKRRAAELLLQMQGLREESYLEHCARSGREPDDPGAALLFECAFDLGACAALGLLAGDFPEAKRQKFLAVALALSDKWEARPGGINGV